MKIAIYPGTFDPITLGHLDIMKKSSKLFNKLIVAIAIDTVKPVLFSLEERIEMIKHELAENNITNVDVETFSGLMVDFAVSKGASFAIRGIRTNSDFEYEFQMAHMNAILNSSIQTIFFPATSDLQIVSSRMVKEVVRLGGNSQGLLSPKIREKLDLKLGQKQF